MRPKPSYMAKLQALAKAKANPAQDQPDEPTQTPEKFYHILNCVLSQKVVYYFPVECNTTPNHVTTTPTHLAVVRMAGERMKCTRHTLECWEVTKGDKVEVDVWDGTVIVTRDGERIAPRFSLITKPFVFHFKEDAHKEVSRILAIELAD